MVASLRYKNRVHFYFIELLIRLRDKLAVSVRPKCAGPKRVYPEIGYVRMNATEMGNELNRFKFHRITVRGETGRRKIAAHFIPRPIVRNTAHYEIGKRRRFWNFRTTTNRSKFTDFILCPSELLLRYLNVQPCHGGCVPVRVVRVYYAV